MNHLDVIKSLKSKADFQRSKNLARFFKTGKGQYGEGDKFLGITVPEQRQVAKKFMDLSLGEIESLLKSEFHECRLTALLILVEKYKNVKKFSDSKIPKFYLKNIKYINNWDLVDLSSHKILGKYLFDRPRDILYKLVNSKNLWQRRIAIVSTASFIAKSDFKDTLKISEILLLDSHDLIHKAVGWMLREVGKKDKKSLIMFLDKHYKKMPRTTLRYSIEKLSTVERCNYLSK